MFFVLEDDDCIHVFASADAAVMAIEALDADECIRAAFDDQGCPYRIEWLQPNKSGRSAFGLRWVENGRYALAPAGPPDRAALLALLTGKRLASAGETLGAVEDLITVLKKSQAPHLP